MDHIIITIIKFLQCQNVYNISVSKQTVHHMFSANCVAQKNADFLKENVFAQS